MQTIRDFDFATVICDGCGRREDSKTANDERLHDYADLIEWKLDDMGWERCDEENEDKWFCPDCASDEKHRTHPGEGRVIVEKAPLFGLRCDLCGKEFEDIDGYSCWADESYVREEASNGEWEEFGGKWYCEDCHGICEAISEALKDNSSSDWEEKYCSKCPYEKDCHESWPKEKPDCSDECRHAFKNEDGSWERCPHYRSAEEGWPKYPIKKCWLIADGGDECPRVKWWREKGIVEQEKENAEARKACKLKEEG